MRNGSGDSVTHLGFNTGEYQFGLRLPEFLLMRIDRLSTAQRVEAPILSRPGRVQCVDGLPIQFSLGR